MMPTVTGKLRSKGRCVKDFEGWDDRIIESLLTVGETRKIRERGVLGNKVNRKLVINGSLQEAETGYDAYLIPPWY